MQRIEPDLSWTERLAMRVRIASARLSGLFLGPAVRELHRGLAPLELVRQQYTRFEQLAATGKPLAYCLCTVE